jgi:hypothetical protein
VSQCWIARRLVCNLCEAMVGSGSVARTAVSSAKVAVVVSHEFSFDAIKFELLTAPLRTHV